MSSASINRPPRPSGENDPATVRAIPPADLAMPAAKFFPLIPQLIVPELEGDEDDNPVPLLESEDRQVTAQPPPPRPPTATPPTPYEKAIARVELLTSHLTPAMRAGLTSLLSTLETHLSPATDGTHHPLIHRVASADTPDDALREMANTIDAGLLAFAARGGRATIPAPVAPPSPAPATPTTAGPVPNRAKSTSTSRSQRVHRECGRRDKGTCILTGKRGAGTVAHILPFSVRASKAIDFWAFLALFHGAAETAALKTAALGPAHNTDVLANVCWMSDDAHRYFGLGQIALLPALTADQLPYNPQLVAEYSATVEFPRGARDVTLSMVRYTPRGSPLFVKFLQPGDSIRLVTADPTTHPLPHPLLWQLHALLSRVMAMKAAAGYPVHSSGGWGSDDGEDGAVEGTQDEMNSAEWTDDDDHRAGLGETRDVLPLQPLHPNSSPGIAAALPPAGIPVALKRSRAITEDDADTPRLVSVVEAEYKHRMAEMWRMMEERLGRPAGVFWCS